jgi:excinuclease UvrABC nuclease subunit
MSKPTKLYRHFDAEGILLYVGISVNALHRLTQHEATKSWHDQISTITIETHPTREAALVAERNAIMRERPIHNIQHVYRSDDGSVLLTWTGKGGRTRKFQMTDAEWTTLSDGVDRMFKNYFRMEREKQRRVA